MVAGMTRSYGGCAVFLWHHHGLGLHGRGHGPLVQVAMLAIAAIRPKHMPAHTAHDLVRGRGRRTGCVRCSCGL